MDNKLTRRGFGHLITTKVLPALIGGVTVAQYKPKLEELISPKTLTAEDPNAKREALRQSLLPRETNGIALPTVTANQATDFALGAGLSVLATKVTRQYLHVRKLNGEIEKLNHKLSYADMSLTELNNHLERFCQRAGIKIDTLESFAEKAPSHAFTEPLDNSQQSFSTRLLKEHIYHMAELLTVHAETISDNTKPFVDQLRNLTTALTGPMLEALGTANPQAASEVLAQATAALVSDSEALQIHLSRALDRTGERIANGVVQGLEQVATEVGGSEQSRNSLQGTTNRVLQSNGFTKAFKDRMVTAVQASTLADDIVAKLIETVKARTITAENPAIQAIDQATTDAIEAASEDYETQVLADKLIDAVADSKIPTIQVDKLERALEARELEADNPAIAAADGVLVNVLETDPADTKTRTLTDNLLDIVADSKLANVLVDALIAKLEKLELEADNPAIAAAYDQLKTAIEYEDGNNKDPFNKILEVINGSDFAQVLVDKLVAAIPNYQGDLPIAAAVDQLDTAINSDDFAKSVQEAVNDSDLAQVLMNRFEASIAKPAQT